MSATNFHSFYQRLSNEGIITSQMELASLLGVKGSAISQAKKRNVIPRTWITEISEKLNLTPKWIKTGIGEKYFDKLYDNNHDFEIVPKVKARLSAGDGSFDVDQKIDEYYSFQKIWLRKKGNPKNMVLMDIVGNSMEPELKDGDTVLVDRSKNEILAGAIYAVGVEDTVLIKRVEKLPDKLVLISDNQKYSPTYISGDDINRVRVLGKVLWICREIK